MKGDDEARRQAETVAHLGEHAVAGVVEQGVPLGTASSMALGHANVGNEIA